METQRNNNVNNNRRFFPTAASCTTTHLWHALCFSCIIRKDGESTSWSHGASSRTNRNRDPPPSFRDTVSVDGGGGLESTSAATAAPVYTAAALPQWRPGDGGVARPVATAVDEPAYLFTEEYPFTTKLLDREKEHGLVGVTHANYTANTKYIITT